MKIFIADDYIYSRETMIKIFHFFDRYDKAKLKGKRSNGFKKQILYSHPLFLLNFSEFWKVYFSHVFVQKFKFIYNIVRLDNIIRLGIGTFHYDIAFKKKKLRGF